MALATPILRVITVLTSSLVLLAGPPKALADNGTAQAKSAAYFRKKFQEQQYTLFACLVQFLIRVN